MPDFDPKEYIRQQARAAGLPEQLALGVVDAESSFDANAIGQEFELSPGGPKTRAYGLFQMTPETAAQYKGDVHNPVDNVRMGITHLKKLFDQYQGNPDQILKEYGGVRANPTYIPNVMQRVLRYQNEAGAGQPPPTTATAPATAPGTTPATAPAAGGPPVPPSILGQLAKRFNLPTITYPWSREASDPANLPPDVAKQWAELHQHDDSGSVGDIVKHSQVINAPKVIAHAYDPRERQGRRNIAGTTAAIATAPLIAAAAPEVLAGSAIASWLYGVGGSAAASALGGVGEESAEQIVEGLRGQRTTPDLGEVASAGGQQFVQDALGHTVLAPVRFGLRAVAGPAFADTVGTALQKEREGLGQVAQSSIDSLSQTARDLRFKFAGDKAARTVATESAVAAARRRATEAVTAGKASTARNVGRVEETTAQDIEAARAAAADALQQGGEHYQQVIGRPPDETAAGTRVVETLEGPAKDEVDALGKALKAVKQAGPEQDITAIQNEARRLVREEILKTEKAFPREAPTQPAAPGAPPPPVSTGLFDASGQPITRPAPPPPPPPASGIDPQLGVAITDAERKAIAEHPAMATIDRLVNAPRKVRFEDLADLETELGATADFDSPVASKIEGARKHLWEIIRKQLGTHEPYNTAAPAYAQARARLSEGYGAAAAKIGDIEPARIIQSIRPDDPLQTATLMRNLRVHSPEAALAVQDAWIYRNVLQGGVDGLGQRIKVLRDRPEFARALFGNRLPSILQKYEGLATGWDQLVASGEQAVARTEGGAAEELAAAKARSALRETKISTLGEAGVEAATAQGKTAQRAAAETHRNVMKRVQDDLAAAGIDKRTAATVTEQEALALGKAQSRSNHLINLILSRSGPHTYRGVVGLVRLLSGPSSADILKIAAGRPEVNRALVNWMADPNAQVSYRVAKRLIGQWVQPPVAARYDKARETIGKAPPTLGGTPLITASPPPAPPR